MPTPSAPGQRIGAVGNRPPRHPAAGRLGTPAQGSTPPGNRILPARIARAGCCAHHGSALSPEGDASLSLSCLQPVLPCKGLPCQAHFNERHSLGHFSDLPKLAPRPRPESFLAAHTAHREMKHSQKLLLKPLQDEFLP